MEEVGSSEVGSSEKVSLSEKVMLMLLAVNGGFWVLAIKTGSRSCHRDVCYQGGCHRGGLVRVHKADQKAHQPRFGSIFWSAELSRAGQA